MKKYIKKIIKESEKVKSLILKDDVLKNDLDYSLNTLPPYSKSDKLDNIKMVIIGQDPTVRKYKSRKDITVTLNLDKSNSLRIYLELVTKKLDIDIEQEVYATNLYKCFFTIPPADNEKILYRHFKYWLDLLQSELKPFKRAKVITLGEPLIKQLIHTGNKKVRHFWDYIGKTKSGKDFKYVQAEDNYLSRIIYPLPHQPSIRKDFYKKYLDSYIQFVRSYK